MELVILLCLSLLAADTLDAVWKGELDDEDDFDDEDR